MPYFSASSASEKHWSGNASFSTFRTSARETAALFSALLVIEQIASTIRKKGYDQPLTRIFRSKFLSRRLKEARWMSMRTPAGSTPARRHTASMLFRVEGLSRPIRNTTLNLESATAHMQYQEYLYPDYF